MKKWILWTVLACIAIACQPTYEQTFHTEDIDNYWVTFDRIQSTQDTALQRQYLEEGYLAKGTEGLQALMEVRRYTSDMYLENIRQYPQFWASIRENTEVAEQHFTAINQDLAKLKVLYPDLRPAPIYFAIGGFRTNGTIQGQKVLIGSEMAMADRSTNASELPEGIQAFYNQYTPIEDLPFLCVHEYVHTQQKEVMDNLLSYCIYEGIPEFVATLATGKEPYLTAIAFGENNYEKVRNKFEEDLFITYRRNNWLWSAQTIFGERDLGYAVGYGMAKRYYEKATDKQLAIKTMIELDYTNEDAVEAFVDGSGYLTKSLEQLYEDYQNARPYVTHLTGVENGSKTVQPGTTDITIHFSEPLNGYNTGVDYGAKGPEAFPKVSLDRIWADDNQSWTISAELEPNKHYQILISNNFRLENGIQLKPYFIEFWTIE